LGVFPAAGGKSAGKKRNIRKRGDTSIQPNAPREKTLSGNGVSAPKKKKGEGTFVKSFKKRRYLSKKGGRERLSIWQK